MMTSAIETLKTWITESDNIVFFGGAGVSTESGIPDFRSTDGLYHQKFDYPPETILSHTFFYQHPEYFFKFYREKMLPLDYQPNEAHKNLAALEQAGCTVDMSNEEICDALVSAMTSLKFTGLTGTDMTWNAEGQVSKAPTAYVVKDGQYVKG